MATVYKWTPFGVALDITAAASTVTRTSATQYTVKINASWETYYSGAKTNYGMTASSGNSNATLNSFGTSSSSGSGSFTGTYSISGNGSATKTITVTFKNFNTDNGNSATKTVSFSVSVPAWTSYTIKYNANGGSGAPSSQTKWKDQALTLSTTKPTRTGYSFLGWSTSSTATTATYSAGGSYTTNAAATLYAVWKANTYTVSFNANGGSGAPSSQTKTYGKTLTLSTTKPTRKNYNFKGWGVSASATTVAYAAGASYTANASITLYAVWELAYTSPRISNVSVVRCNSDGEVIDDGQNALVSFDYECDYSIKTVTFEWKVSSETAYSKGATFNYGNMLGANDPSGSISKIIGDDGLSIENTYDIRISVNDGGGSSYAVSSLMTLKFSIDIRSGGTGIAFGKAAEQDNIADFGYQVKFTGGIEQVVLADGTDLNDLLTPNIYSGSNATSANYVNLPFTSGTFTLVVESSGPSGQIKQTVTLCDKSKARAWERYYYSNAWGDWKCIYDFQGTVLWSGGWYMTSGHTITLSEKVSVQPHGIVLVFSEYVDGEAKNQSFVSHFISKRVVSNHGGCGHCFQMSNSNLNYFATKYLYISDDKIVGHDNNSLTGTGNTGISYTNNRFVLRYVIGV